jgi:deazaflavin-dependent oxidoreductase (nitroreductase family)
MCWQGVDVLVTWFWRLINPLVRPLSGWAPWWVLVETTGRRTGKIRRTPLAAGPRDEASILVIAVHGRHSAWVTNAEAQPHVRIRYRGRWRDAQAEILTWDVDLARKFNAYARSGPAVTGRDPLIVRFSYLPAG